MASLSTQRSFSSSTSPGERAIRAGRSPMFVHDFSAVDLPVDETVRNFTTMIPAEVMAAIVQRVWNEEAPILASLQLNAHHVRTTQVSVEVGGHRLRGDAAIINVRWHGDGWLPSLDADLELVSFGRQRTHLHLMGRYELPGCIDRFSPTGSLVHRVMVVVVRQFLTELSSVLVGAMNATSTPTTP